MPHDTASPFAAIAALGAARGTMRPRTRDAVPISLRERDARNARLADSISDSVAFRTTAADTYDSIRGAAIKPGAYSTKR